MNTYTTQMDAAKQGIITPEMKTVAAKEYRTEEEIRDLFAKGQVVICANKRHTCIDPNGVGSMLRRACGRKVGLLRIVTNDEIHKRTNSDCITTAGFYRFSKKGYRTSWLSL